MNVTRNVITDLWALSSAGEASEDSRRLIDEFLAQDTDLARALREERSDAALAAPIELPPDHEATTLDGVKRELRRRSPFRLPALLCTGLAVVRMIEDTTFTASPRGFAGTAAVAVVCWVLYSWHTRRIREAGLPKPAAR